MKYIITAILITMSASANAWWSDYTVFDKDGNVKEYGRTQNDIKVNVDSGQDTKIKARGDFEINLKLKARGKANHRANWNSQWDGGVHANPSMYQYHRTRFTPQHSPYYYPNQPKFN